MLRNARTAVKFFTYGIIVGILFAPQSGAETRKKIFGMLGDSLNETMGAMTGGGNSGNQTNGQ
jgi:gas vesicle protein